MKISLIFSLLITIAICEIPYEYLKAESSFEVSNGELERDERIVGGSPVNLGQIPYFALILMITIPQEIAHQCGGSLIYYNWVLTAAHCLTPNLDQHQVLLGIVNRSTQPSWSSGFIGRENLFPNVAFNPVTFNNDIGLIRINTNPTILLIPSINTISLPLSSDIPNTFVGQTATASGFGVIIGGSFSNFLHAVDLTVMANPQCSIVMPQYITLGSICTLNPGASSVCFGDGGGPLVTQVVVGRRALIGVVSFTHLGCTTGIPGAFTRVTSYLGWISSILGGTVVTTTTQMTTTTTNSTNTTTSFPNIPPRTTTRRGSASTFALSSSLLSVLVVVVLIMK